MYSCSKCKSNDLAPDEFACYKCYTCINCGGCGCEPEYEPDYPTQEENEDGFMDNDYGQQSI